jgi:hypothetical protein
MKHILAVLFVLSIVILAGCTSLQYPDELKEKTISVATYYPKIPQYGIDVSGSYGLIPWGVFRGSFEKKIRGFYQNIDLKSVIKTEKAVFEKKMQRYILFKKGGFDNQTFKKVKFKNQKDKLDYDFSGIKDKVSTDYVFTLEIVEWGFWVSNAMFDRSGTIIRYSASIQNVKTGKIIWVARGRTRGMYGLEVSHITFSKEHAVEYTSVAVEKMFKEIFKSITGESEY